MHARCPKDTNSTPCLWNTGCKSKFHMVHRADLVLSLFWLLLLTLTPFGLRLGFGGSFGLCFGLGATTAYARSIRGRAGWLHPPEVRRKGKLDTGWPWVTYIWYWPVKNHHSGWYLWFLKFRLFNSVVNTDQDSFHASPKNSCWRQSLCIPQRAPGSGPSCALDDICIA